MALFTTADICDGNATFLATGELRILPPIFQMYGKRRAFSGAIATVKVFEDNVLVKELAESDGGGSMRCAVLGGNISLRARNTGWAGIVVYGCIRDVDEINGCDIGVRALGLNPRKPGKERVGAKHVPVYVAGDVVRDGEWLYADADGILVSKIKLNF